MQANVIVRLNFKIPFRAIVLQKPIAITDQILSTYQLLVYNKHNKIRA